MVATVSATDGEKDPRCLLLAFRCIQVGGEGRRDEVATLSRWLLLLLSPKTLNPDTALHPGEGCGQNALALAVVLLLLLLAIPLHPVEECMP